MTTAKSKRKRTSERDEENKQVIQCLERKLAWRKHNIQPENLMNSFLYIQGPLQMNMGFPKKETRVPGLINNKVDIELQNPLSFLTVYFGHQM